MIVYHYTIPDCGSAILRSGAILPATAFVADGVKPVVWFSANKTWEPTASKMIVYPNGMLRTLTFPEMAKLGLVRFASPSDTLLTWAQIIEATGESDAMVKSLERIARKQGARPSDWYGSLEPVSIEGLIMEFYQSGVWQQVGQLSEAA